MINPLRSQPTRLMGMSSGMDTDLIIQQTLKMHQFRIDNQLRSRRLIEWRQQTHNSIRNEITNLRQTFMSNLSPRSLLNRNAFNATTSSVSGANSAAVTIRTNAGSPLGNFQINGVKQLAQGAHLATTAGVSGTNSGFASSARLGDMDFNGSKIDWTHEGGTVRVGNENIKIEKHGSNWTFTNNAGDDITAAVNWNGSGPLTISAGGTSRTLNWDAANNRFMEDRAGVFASEFTISDGEGGTRPVTVTATKGAGDTWSFSSSVGTASLNENGEIVVRIGAGANARDEVVGAWDATAQTIGGADLEQQTQLAVQLAGETRLTFNTRDGAPSDSDVTVTISANDTLSEMMTRINSSAGVSMSYDRLSDRFTLETSLSSGSNPADARLTASSESGNFFSLISGQTAPTFENGQEAVAFINGEEVRSNTNTFDFRGVGITLNSTFNAGFDPNDTTTQGSAVSVTLTRDATPVVETIKDFINSYNTIISRLEGLLSERKTGNEASYRPLTDEEKQGMSDRQIEEWEAIARKGILRNDSGIQNLVSNLRRSFFEEIEGLGISASQIGLTTGSFFDGTGGQIMIDEERLRAAIERDPDMVANIFTRIDNSGPQPRGVGLLHKIDGLMRDFVNTNQSQSLRNLEASLQRTNEQIERMTARMHAEEDRLYKQFAAMETALSKLQSQGDWFASMLGG